MIDTFRGDFAFLSNMYPCNVEYEGLVFSCSESAFQSMKNLDAREQFVGKTGQQSKHIGKSVRLRADWENVKTVIMLDVLLAKFKQNPDLATKLLETGDQLLVECNTWGDTYWGVCHGQGLNVLGRSLMMVREVLHAT